MVGKSGRETAGEGGVSMGRRGSQGTQDRHDALSEPMVLGATVSTVNRFMTGADEVGGGEASKARGGVYERWRSGSGRERERERERERVFCWLGEEGGGFNDASLKDCLGAGNEPMVQGAALDVLNSKG
jgi:hypothetical protein